jgi:hypothetical protein
MDNINIRLRYLDSTFGHFLFRRCTSTHFFVFRMLASFVLIRSAFLAFIIFGLEFRLVAT